MVTTTSKFIVKVVLYAGLALVALAQIFPLIWMFNFSLLKSGDFFGSYILKWPEPFQWKNYSDAFNFGHVPAYLLNSIIVTVVVIAVTVVVSLMLSYVIARIDWKWNKYLAGLVMICMIVPIYATLLPNFFIFTNTKLIDTYLALILPNIAFMIPISVFIFMGFMQTTPRAIEEAAVIDGLNLLGVVFRIIFPISKPVIASVTVLTFMSTWNEFIMAVTYIRSDSFKTLPFSLIQFTGQYASNYGAQFAVMTIIALPSVLLYMLFTEQITNSLTAGAVKG
ncbi:carbohydrate ABC transporter permease [Paenibacillus radicis (ex Gao et al. 2016)]|uniref:ABC transporter permease protein YurM n=1 Tax=Paenibacillus radicis (ex Gao et al. 2016) TaxID=1737354 RepID=A0A917GQC0_9BACL|nr:carbohydrate ABC transporter permease [Paenibacillus radicis (ex Gao et al. 2016)]GGG54154.1 putative ABC transporter permease protein YurM [Paenibacillus radicis (ex Gao et al. 2016)]